MNTQIQPLAAADNAAALSLWEATARATHGFVTEEHILQYKVMVKEMLDTRPLDFYGLYVAEGATGEHKAGTLLAFMGIAEQDLGVLFVANGQRGKGYGSLMTRHALQELGVRTVDVNEQNVAACAFYEHMGFCVQDRSPVDGMGNPYPLLHMALK